ncbi:MAG: NAD(P)-binding domain-containing protein [Hyphomicrobiaceae bacterium]
MNLDTIGVIGNTSLAAAIAVRLAGGSSGPRVIVHGLDAAQLATLPKRSPLERAPNLFDLASECEAVIAAFDTHAALREALTGTADRPGLLGAMAPGTILIDMSGGLPGDSLRLAGQLAGGAIGLVEIGVANLSSLVTGEARLFAGGFGEHISDLTPVLSRLGTIKRAGPQGSGRMLAALTESIRATYHAAMAEAQAIAEASGIVPDELADPPVLDDERREFAAQLKTARAIAAAHNVETPILDVIASR